MWECRGRRGIQWGRRTRLRDRSIDSEGGDAGSRNILSIMRDCNSAFTPTLFSPSDWQIAMSCLLRYPPVRMVRTDASGLRGAIEAITVVVEAGRRESRAGRQGPWSLESWPANGGGRVGLQSLPKTIQLLVSKREQEAAAAADSWEGGRGENGGWRFRHQR